MRDSTLREAVWWIDFWVVKLEENGATTIFKDGWVYPVEGSVMSPKIHRTTQGEK